MAFLQIQKEFGEFPDLAKFIEQYEHKQDTEALFVYALDKIVPVLNIYMDEGRTWKDIKLTEIVVTLEKLREHKDEKIRKSPEFYNLWVEFVAILENRRSELFLE